MKRDSERSSIVRNFLFGIFNKEFLIFLFFLFLSGTFWLILALNEDCERELRIPLTLTGQPKNSIVTDINCDTLRVTVRDKGYMLLPYIYGDVIHPLPLSFKAVNKSHGKGLMTSNELAKQLRTMLFKSTAIVSIKPDHYEFAYIDGENKKVPVRFRGNVEPSGASYLDMLIISPDKVEIYANKDKLDSIKSVYTENITVSDLKDSTEMTVKLKPIPGVKIQPSEVKVEFYTDILTQTDCEVEVKAVNMPEGMILRTFPPKVKVHYSIGSKRMKEVTEKHFTIVADYKYLLANHSKDLCPLTVQSKPLDIKNLRLEPDQVKCVTERQDKP